MRRDAAGRLSFLVVGGVVGAILLVASVSAQGQTPGTGRRGSKSPAVSASKLPDGRVQLENEELRFIFDPADAGAASSIFHKATGKELAGCVGYGDTRFNAFRESLHAQKVREGRIDPTGQVYKLVGLETQGDTAVAQFAGYPYVLPLVGLDPWESSRKYVPSPEQRGSQQAYGKVKILKTYKLRAGESRLDVELRAVNESDEKLPLALWILSGLRVEGEDIDSYTPSPEGVVARDDFWDKPESSFVVVPRAAGAWTAAVGRNQGQTGMYIAAQGPYVEAFLHWLGKFAGFTLSFGTPLVKVDPEQALTVSYSFVAMRDVARVDGASRELACGVNFAEERVGIKAPFRVSLQAVAPRATDVTASLVLQRLPEKQETKIGEAKLHLDPGRGKAATFSAHVDGEGTYLFVATLKPRQGDALRAERAFVVGRRSATYTVPVAKLDGQACWAGLRLTVPRLTPPPPTPMDLAQPFEEQLAKLGDVEWKKEDSVEGHLTWYGLKDGVAVADAKRKVVSRFQGLDGREHVKINGIAFGTDYVWLATDDGLMAWNRQQAYWGRFAVAGTLLDVPVTEVSVAEGGKLRVTVVEEGAKPRRFEYDPNTVKWRELD